MKSSTFGAAVPPPEPLPRQVFSSFVLAKLAIAALETLFALYYVDVFLNVHGLTNKWFYIGQSIYIVWNAINDPLFAWFQDRTRGSKRSALRWGGPLLALSFMMPFIPLGAFIGGVGGGEAAVGLHFLFSLCFFDGVFTYTCLAHCALFAEVTSVQSERMRLMRAAEGSMLLTAPLVLVANRLFVREALAPFRLFAILIAILCAGTLVYASKHVRSCSDAVDATTTTAAPCATSVGACTRNRAASEAPPPPPLRIFLSQFLRHRSMLLFVALNFLQVLTLAFYNSFLTIILASLQLGTVVSWMSDVGGLVLAGSQLLPPIIILALAQPEEGEEAASHKRPLSPLSPSAVRAASAAAASPSSPTIASFSAPAASYDDRAYRVVRGLTWLKVVLSLGMLLYGFPSSSSGGGGGGVLLFALFLFLSRALASATFAFFNVVLSELIDEDRVLHGRVAPMSSSYFGLNALATKPAQSIAPVLVVGVWSLYGFRQAEIEGAGADGTPPPDPILSSPQAPQLQQVIFLCCTLGPLLIGLAQAALWHFYTLRGARLQRVKQQLHAMDAAASSIDTDPSPESVETELLERGAATVETSGLTDDESDAVAQSQQLLDVRDKRRHA